MAKHLEPHAESICRLCREAFAQVRFTEQANVIDVLCPSCGRFRIENPGYHIDLNGLNDEQRRKLLAFVAADRASGEESPLITRDRLHEVSGVAP
jgi:hypothetical protein